MRNEFPATACQVVKRLSRDAYSSNKNGHIVSMLNPQESMQANDEGLRHTETIGAGLKAATFSSSRQTAILQVPTANTRSTAVDEH